MSRRRRALVLLPYGMNLRNVVLNERLWSYLRQSYDVDVLTPLDLDTAEDFGICRVLRYADHGLSHRWAMRLLRGEFYLRYLPFFLDLGLGAELQIVYHRWLRDDTARKEFLWLGAMGRTQAGRWLGHMLSRLSVADAWIRRLVRRGGYSLVLCTHTHEFINILVSRAARKAGIPVACMMLGHDNLVNHGPMLMKPDLLLVWGEQQAVDFERLQRRFDPRLGSIRIEPTGNPVYDAYLNGAARNHEEFLASHRLDRDRRIILLTVTVDWFIPGQDAIAESILGAIRGSDSQAVLLIRPRPGGDTHLWEALARRFPDHVRVQVPTGSGYFTGESKRPVRLSEEIEAVRQFAETLHHAELVITSTPSTIWLDALVFGRPTITVAYNEHLDSGPTPLRVWLDCEVNREVLEHYVIARSPRELASLVSGHLSGSRKLSPASPSLLVRIAGVTSESSGVRTVRAVQRLVDGFPDDGAAGSRPGPR